MDKEMKKALEADGEKLRQLTGEDHGPVFLETCPECGGEGGREVSKPQRDDPHFAVWVPCWTCNQSGFV